MILILLGPGQVLWTEKKTDFHQITDRKLLQETQ